MSDVTPIEKVLDALYLVTGKKPKRTFDGWQGLCPGHDDHDPSLSVKELQGGTVLVHCHARCNPEVICAAVGLTLADLFPASTSTKTSRPRRKGEFRRRRHAEGNGTAFATAEEVIVHLEQQRGQCSGRWSYYDINGELIAVVLRWDTPKKDFRPVSRNGSRWQIGWIPDPRPLYRLPELAKAKRVYVAEGEKAADAANSIGLTGTTSPNGSSSASKADWSPLAGKEVVILPDNDPPGQDYADDVVDQLGCLTPPPVVRIVELPDLPEGGDIADWLDMHDAVEPDTLRSQLESLVDQASLVELPGPGRQVDHFQPFPVEALPEPVRGFVQTGAKAIGCDLSFIALPMLAALASAIGNTRRIRLKQGWTEPPILWCAVVAESGDKKSPPLDLVKRPLEKRQRKSFKEHAERMNQYLREMQDHDQNLKEWGKSGNGDPPVPPIEPVVDRCWFDDATVEAIAVLLQQQPRGLLRITDELSGWLGGFDRYSVSKGGDVAKWLEMHGGRSMMVDRKTGNHRTLYVQRAAVSIAGTIQPDVLGPALGKEHFANGLAARLLLACPPKRVLRWTDDDIDPETENSIECLFDWLFELRPNSDGDGEPYPKAVDLTPAGKREFVQFYNEHADERANLTGALSAAWSKLEGYAARFALVIHFTRLAAGDSTLENPDAVDAASIRAGVVFSRWFGNEARRMYAILSESDEERENRRLADWIERKGGSVTVREVQQGHRRFRLATDAEAALQPLVEAGYGDWEPPSPDKRGRPTRRFALSTPSTVYGNTPNPGEEGHSVDVDTKGDDEWGGG